MKMTERAIKFIMIVFSIMMLISPHSALADKNTNKGNGNGNSKDITTPGKGNGKAVGLGKKSDKSDEESDNDDSGETVLVLNTSAPADTDDNTDQSGDDSGDETPPVDEEEAPTEEDTNGKGKGRSNVMVKNGGNGNASDGIKGRVVTNKDIVYTGEALEIGIHFAQGADLIHDGEADAYLIIFAPQTEGAPDPDPEPPEETETEIPLESNDPVESEPESNPLADAVVVPVSDDASTGITKLFEVPEVDLSGVAAGTYQLGLVLTIPGGDPLSVNDWYNGFLGLVDIVGLTISAEAVDADQDGDGMMDCEAEVDGLICDNPDDPADPDDGS